MRKKILQTGIFVKNSRFDLSNGLLLLLVFFGKTNFLKWFSQMHLQGNHSRKVAPDFSFFFLEITENPQNRESFFGESFLLSSMIDSVS